MKTIPEKNYSKLIECLDKNFRVFDKKMKKLLQADDTLLEEQFEKYVLSSSKRIRSALIFLTSLALFGKVSEKGYSAALAVELLHNASLIHDDVIDNSKIRRQAPSLNAIFSDKLAVIAGDFLFSLAFRLIVSSNPPKTVLSYIDTFKRLCIGEIEQFFMKNQLPSMKKYLEKSANKTSSLFEIGIENAFSGEVTKEQLKALKDFAHNFGLAFQLNNDLKNLLEGADDFKDGIYTAAVIYACQKDKKILQSKNPAKSLEKLGAIEYTKKMISKYVKKAVDNLSFIEDNDYKFTLVSVCRYLEEI